MWFGTQDGLNMFDGYKFTVYRHNPEDESSISANHITSLYEDKHGGLWIGTIGGGLNFFNRSRGTFACFKHDEKNPASLSNDTVSIIFNDSRDNLWIGTEDGLNLLNPKNGSFKRYTHDDHDLNSLGDNNITSIDEDHQGSLWIGTMNGGLDKMDRTRGTFTHYRHNPDRLDSLSHDYVWGIFEDGKKRLWVGTWGGGINRFDRKTGSFIHYQHKGYDDSVAKCIYEDRAGVLWVGSKSRGLYQFDERTETFINVGQSLSNTYIASIYEDRGGVLWVGTLSGGVNTYNRNTMKSVIRHYRHIPYQTDSISNNVVWAVFEDSMGDILVGTDEGISRIHGKDQTVSHGLKEIKDSVRSLFEDKNGFFWAGTLNSGLFKLSKDLKVIKQYKMDNSPNCLSENTVLCIYGDGVNSLWIGTWGGLNHFDIRKESFVHYKNNPGDPNSLSHDVARTVIRDHTGILWVGTSSGLNVYNEETKTFKVYKNDPENHESLSNNTVRCILQSKNGNLWIGTNGGLNRYEKASDSFTSFREQDGLSNDTVYGILEDDQGYLWLSTNKGLSRFDPKTGIFKNYDIRDGLQSNEFNAGAYFKGNNNRLFFGGGNGFNILYPHLIKSNSHKPPVVLTRFQKNFQDSNLDHLIYDTDRIVLSKKDPVFSLEFAALDFTEPEKNIYSYKLEGFDKDWINSGSRRIAIYTNLDDGDYTFKVKGTNNDGVWGEETSLAIRITPMWWETGWFKSIIIIMGLVISYVFFHFYKLKERFSNIVFMGKYISHEISNPLVSIRSGCDLLARHFDKTGAHGKEFKITQNIMSGVMEAGEAIEAFKDLDAKRPSPNTVDEILPRIDILSLTEQTVLSFKEMYNRNPVNIAFQTDHSGPLMISMNPIDFKIILKNLLKNAVRAVNEKSLRASNSEDECKITVRVSLQKKWKSVVVDVTDTGCGMDKKTVKKCMNPCFSTKNSNSGLGLSIVQNKIDKYNMKIKITSEENIGSTFRILIPERIVINEL
ncbi:MAG: two-component regulator propeller domain-containing protein [Desulfobacteraceae bacterium]